MTSKRWILYAAIFLALESSAPAALQIANEGAASNVQFSTATLHADLLSTGAAAPVVKVFWGTVDRETNFAWAFTNNFGLAATTGLQSVNISGLNTGTVYYFRSFCSNASELAWATNSVCWTTRVVSAVGRFLLIGPDGVISNCTNFAAANGMAGPGELTVITNRIASNSTAIAGIDTRVDLLEAASNNVTNVVSKTGDIVTGPFRFQSDVIIESIGYNVNYLVDPSFETGLSSFVEVLGSVVWTNSALRLWNNSDGGGGTFYGSAFYSTAMTGGSYEIIIAFTNVSLSTSFVVSVSTDIGGNTTNLYSWDGVGDIPTTISATGHFYSAPTWVSILVTSPGTNGILDFDSVYANLFTTNVIFRISTNGVIYGPGTNIVWSAP